MLERLREHPHAPRWSFPCGDRLTKAFCEKVAAFETGLRQGPAGSGWTGAGTVPDWLAPFVERCLRDVPFYRRTIGSSSRFDEIPTCGRGDLGREPWAFVPDNQPLDELLAYYTSGTTGNAVSILSHPVTAGSYLAALRVILGRADIEFGADSARVAIAQICAQSATFTHATIMSYLAGAGYVKVNLNPHEWRNLADPVRFLDEIAPEILTGDPVAFMALSSLPVTLRPKALVSSAMTLMPGLRLHLERHFGCPVFDLYSLNESRFIAVAGRAGHQVLPHDVFIEILDHQGRPCSPGVRGEIVLSCPRNPFLPLLRYRTGDFAALDWIDGTPVLQGLEGRAPTVFLTGSGEVVNSIDVTRVLRDLPMAQFTLAQNAGGGLVFEYRGSETLEPAIRVALEETFGEDIDMKIDILPDSALANGKAVTYTSAVPAEQLSGKPWKYRPADA